PGHILLDECLPAELRRRAERAIHAGAFPYPEVAGYRGVLGWGLGLLLAGGALLAYVASRTVGMPGLPAEPDAWLEPMGVASLVCEGLFVVLFVLAQRARTGASQ